MEMTATGLQINYYFICKKKLWLYSKGISLEHTNDKVAYGKLLEEDYYSNKKFNNVSIDNLINIDLFDSEFIREVKYSQKMMEASKYQILYYLYYLKHKLGIEKKGVINFPRQHRKEEVSLNKKEEEKIENILKDIELIKKQEKCPEMDRIKICSSCAYFDFCFAGEKDG